MIPHKCPVCDGAGGVSRPPWIAGDVYTWSGASTEQHPCKACGGTGIVWELEPSPHIWPAPKLDWSIPDELA